MTSPIHAQPTCISFKSLPNSNRLKADRFTKNQQFLNMINFYHYRYDNYFSFYLSIDDATKVIKYLKMGEITSFLLYMIKQKLKSEIEEIRSKNYIANTRITGKLVDHANSCNVGQSTSTNHNTVSLRVVNEQHEIVWLKVYTFCRVIQLKYLK